MTVFIYDFLGRGTHAARPASPPVPAGGTAIFYETDTGHTFVWTGSVWAQIDGGGGGSAPAVVQVKAAAGSIQGVTTGVAATDRHLLVAFVTGGSFPANTGWFRSALRDLGGSTLTDVFWKIAQSEPTTLDVLASPQPAAMVVYEIKGGVPFFDAMFFDGTGTAETLAANCPGQTLAPSSLLIGAVLQDTNGVQPTSITGATANDAATNGSSRAAAGFTIAAPTAGTNNVTANYASSTPARLVAMNVIQGP